MAKVYSDQAFSIANRIDVNPGKVTVAPDKEVRAAVANSTLAPKLIEAGILRIRYDDGETVDQSDREDASSQSGSRVERQSPAETLDADEPEASPPPQNLDDYSVNTASMLISQTRDVNTLMNWLDHETQGRGRQGMLRMLESRLREVGSG